VHLAAGVTIQALVDNKNEAASWSSGTPVQVCLPADALRVLLCETAGEAGGEAAGEAAGEAGGETTGEAAAPAAGSVAAMP
jgi:hypothetical protein